MKSFEEKHQPPLSKPMEATEKQWTLIQRLTSYEPEQRPMMSDVISLLTIEKSETLPEK
jgi:hypothetical protein